MRIVVSGTHASGKSTLISDFALRHPDFVLLPDPFELLDEDEDQPSEAMFAAQLRASADRLVALSPEADVIAERGPLDFLAYLLATAELAGRRLPGDFLQRALLLTVDAMAYVDLLVVLPLEVDDSIRAGVDEHLALREATDDRLLDLVDDPDLVGHDITVLELAGEPMVRLEALERAVMTTP
jgi:hypothetical protein